MAAYFQGVAFLREPIRASDPSLAAEWNEHLAQRHPRIKLMTVMHGDEREIVGVTLILEADDLAQAKAFLSDSPYQQAGRYQPVQIFEVAIQVGRLS